MPDLRRISVSPHLLQFQVRKVYIEKAHVELRCMAMSKIIKVVFLAFVLISPSITLVSCEEKAYDLQVPPDQSRREEKPRVLFDGAHVEVEAKIYIPDFLLELKNNGLWVESSISKITSELLSDYDLLVFFLQSEMLSDDEMDSVISFVENGGGLILFGEHGRTLEGRDIDEALSQTAGFLGIEYGLDVVRDEKVNAGDECWPVITNFAQHQITEDVKSLVYGCGTSLNLDSHATAIAFGNETTTAGEKKGKEIVLLASTLYGRGKVVVVGDRSFLVGPSTVCGIAGNKDFLSLGDNKKLGINMFKWAAQPSPEIVSPSELDINEGDELTSEGYSLFSQRDYSQAKVRFERALEIYLGAGVKDRTSEIQTMIDKCEIALRAETAYEKGIVYYNSGNCRSAEVEFEKSRDFYDQIGDGTGSAEAQLRIEESNECITFQEAGTAFGEGDEYFKAKNYESAKSKFSYSKSLYSQTGNAEDCEKAQSMIDICDKYIFAEERWKMGIQYYENAEYEEAVAIFVEAKSLYQELDDQEKIEEMERQLEKTYKVQGWEDMKEKTLILFGILMTVAIVSLMIVIFLRKPEESQSPLEIPNEKTYCPFCGKENPSGAPCCSHCGKPLTSIDEVEWENVLGILRKKRERGEISEKEFLETARELKEKL
jgi:tetratricopeptide (TPR) repeat protein